MTEIKSAHAFLIYTPIDNQFPVVEIPVNDINLNFIVDTSIEFSTVTPDVASLVGLTDTGTTLLSVGIEEFEVDIFTGGSFLIDSDTTVPIDFFVGEIEGLPPVIADNVDGRLGIDFLKSTNSIISVDNKLLTINPEFEITEIGFNAAPTVLLTVVDNDNNSRNLVFAVDTGASHTFLTTESIEGLNLTELPVGRVTGNAATDTTNQISIQLGEFNDIGSQSFAVFEQQLPNGIDGLLGRNVISSVDFENNSVVIRDKQVLTPGQEPQPPQASDPQSTVEVRFINIDTTIPEPSSIISLLALGTLGATSILKQKLKPSKSTEDSFPDLHL